VFHLIGAWRWIYVVGAATALYLNVFVLIVQAFLKVPLLNALAPTQTEPPFLITQVVVLAIFVVLTVLGVWAATSLTRSATHTGSKNWRITDGPSKKRPSGSFFSASQELEKPSWRARERGWAITVEVIRK
jgi:hypothetical protein